MRIQARLRPIAFDLQSYKAALHRHMETELKASARAWLERIIFGPLHDGSGMPVWSGASAATFRDLASKISYSFSISPVAPSRINLGASHGSGELLTEPKRGKYVFRYTTTLPHLIFNESNTLAALKRPGPYNFRAAGRETFEEFAGKVKLLNPFKFLKADKVISIQ